MVSILEVIGSLTLAIFLYKLLLAYHEGGLKSVLYVLTCILRAIPGVDNLLNSYVKQEVGGFVGELCKDDGINRSDLIQIPEAGEPYEDLLKEIHELKNKESDVQNKVFAYKYVTEDRIKHLQELALKTFSDKMDFSDNHQKLIEEVQACFMNENALNPIAFPSLRKFELEVVAMTASMLNAPPGACGSITSGGTESILMAVKTYRDFARKHRPHITTPEILAPRSIHPAFNKAAYYFGLKLVKCELNSRYECDVTSMEKMLTPNTVMIAASAPAYPHGLVDPIPEISRLALRHKLPFHVDGCYGGFILPWIERLRDDVPVFDFRNEGVTSVSADLHKFGYTPKGASVVVYKTESLRKYQFFTCTDWSGGLFGSTTMAGTRSGSVMAAAWVTLKHIGQNGYTQKAKQLLDTTATLMKGVENIQGVEVVGYPVMNCFAIKSCDDNLNILVMADAMEKLGWRMERQQLPDSIHFSILPQHIGQENKLLGDLSKCCQECMGKKAVGGDAAAMYGMIGKIPDKTLVDDFVVEYFSKVYM